MGQQRRAESLPTVLQSPHVTDDDDSSTSDRSGGEWVRPFDFLRRNPNYLIRLCQNSLNNSSKEWKCIERCCAMICQVFDSNTDGGLEDDDDDSDALSSKTRQQLLQTDMWGNTSLHVICYYRPPVKVVEAILTASHRALGNPTKILTMTNNKGETPLLIACKSGACQNVIQALMKDGVAIAIHDDFGSSSFTALCSRYNIVKRIPALQSRHVELNDICNKTELIPKCWTEREVSSSSSTSTISASARRLACIEKIFTDWVTFDPTSEDTSVFPYFWLIMEDLFHAAWCMYPTLFENHDNKVEYISNVHGAAFVADVLPFDMTDMILRTHSIEECNNNSKSHSLLKPLHSALTRKISSHPKARRQHAHFFKQIVDMDPLSVSSFSFGSSSSRSAFCQAIALGHYWTTDRDMEGPVQTLFLRCPDAVSHPDRETGLLPFMLAAAAAAATADVESKDKGNHNEENDCSQLDTIYNLLRAAPNGVRI